MPTTIYVSTAGNDNNDGSYGSPVASAQKALSLCEAAAAASAGAITIDFAAGSYSVTAALSYTSSVLLTSPVTFKGKKDGSGVPTVILNAYTAYGYNFITATNNVRFAFTDIKFQSFATALASSRGSGLTLTNVNSLDCKGTVSLGNGGWAYVNGGDWDGRDLGGTVLADGTGLTCVIGSLYNLAQANDYSGLKIHHWDRGAVVDECGSGHMDYLQIEDCAIGCEITRGAGAPNMTGIRFYRCTTGILGRNAPNLLISDTADFGQGTADACDTNILLAAGSTDSQIEGTGFDSRSIYKRARVSFSTITGDTSEHTAWSAFSIVRGRMRERDMVADFHVDGICSGGLSAAATMKLKFGSTVLASWTLPIGTAQFSILGSVTALNSTDVLGKLLVATGGASTLTWVPVQISTTTGVVSLTAETAVAFTITLGNSADKFKFVACHAYSSIAGITA